MTDINVDLITENVEIPVNIEEKVSDYNILDNKPSINGVELVGNKTNADLGIEVDTSKFPTREELDNKQDKGDYATREEVAQGFEQKQDKGNYATKDEIPDLTDYVKNTDYATATTGGVIKQSSTYGSGISGGFLYATSKTQETYNSSNDKIFIGKGTLENIKDDYVKRGITANTTELTEDEKASAKQWLGYATQSDINTAIASLPQFKISIVQELPETGEKMVLYLVPKDGEAPDVYNEYIWIEQTSTFEFLGSTAVDLTDYVKNTDYAGDVGGVIKISSVNGLAKASNGYLLTSQKTLEDYNSGLNNMFIGKGTLENIKNDLFKRAVTTNDIELTDDEKISARTWLGAVGSTDYAGNTAGVIKSSVAYSTKINDGFLTAVSETLDNYNVRPNTSFVSKGTLENIKDDYVKRGLTENAIEFTDEEKTSARTLIGAVGSTDYAGNNKVGLISAQYGYGLSATSSGHLYCNVRTLEDYNGSLVNSAFISKGTLNNVLTQYSKTVLITEDDYNTLETKDTNTLYLIEE